MPVESIDGILKKVMFHKPSKYSPAGVPYLIAALHNGITVKGELRRPIEGERYRFYGEYRRDRKYPDRESFEFSSHEILIDQSADGVAQYLAAHVKGVGRARAAGLVDAFGAETLHVLRTTPDRASEVPGIAPELVDAIRRHFEDDCRIDPAAYARLVDLFADFRLPRSVLETLLKDWGSDAPGKVLDNPYVLLDYPRMSWENVDAFAVGRAGYDRAGIERHKAAILEALERVAADGHTVAPKVDVEEAAFRLLEARPASAAWAALVDRERVAVLGGEAEPGGTLYALPKLAAAEAEIAGRLAMLARTARPMELPGEIEGLNGEQREAVKLIAANGVAVLVGAPGVGKSFLVSRLIREVVDRGLFVKIRVACPTGKAAKRAAELLAQPLALGGRSAGVPCTTIHRALGPTPSGEEEGVPAGEARVGRGRDEFGFAHNADNPIDVSLLVVDECSMLDVRLASALLSAISPGTRVLFVGDPNQLPSVGPGSFLRDMIAAGVPTATLNEIQRSDSAGTVVHACHAIKDGRMPVPAANFNFPMDNWVHIERDDPHAIAAEIVELVAKIQAGSKLGLDPIWEVQVISAQNERHAFGCRNLNALLSEQLNPEFGTGQPPRRGGRDPRDDRPFLGGPDGEMVDADATEETGPRMPFRIGDKVVRRKNGLADRMVPFVPGMHDRADWTWAESKWAFREVDVVNGDMGSVEDIVPHDRGTWVVVKFRTPTRLCRLPLAECHLIQAFAITVHLSQGSGFPLVIMPVHPAFFWDPRKKTGLWCRELFYTMLSRVEKGGVTIGPIESIRLAVGRRTIGNRRTRLRELLKEGMAAADERERKRERKRARITIPESIRTPLSAFGLATLPGSVGDLKKIYHRLMLIHHPDRGGDNDTAQSITVAYAALLEQIQGRR